MVIEAGAADIAGVWLSSKIVLFLQLSLQAWSTMTEFIHIHDFLIYFLLLDNSSEIFCQFLTKLMPAVMITYSGLN